MQIRGKTVLVFDIEVFHNIFHCSIKNSETGDITTFEISPRKNQLREIVKYFKQVNKPISWGDYYTTGVSITSNYIFCGYNNLHYDNPIINYIIEYEDKLLQYNVATICESLFSMSKTITTSTEDNIDAWKHWKYQIWFDTFDLLTMLYSSKLRVGLKELQVTMEYPNVQEFVTDWDKPLPIEDFDNMIQYNINDIESTCELLNRCKKDINLRIAIEDQHKVKCLSKDGVGIGVELLKKEYLEKTGLSWNDIKDLRSPMNMIPLKDVILPNISFKDPILRDLLNEMKTLTVSPGIKGWNKKFYYGGLQISVGVGGIHSINTPSTFSSDETYSIAESDANSLYPSLICAYGFYPLHLKKEIFLSIYNTYRLERLEDKKAGRKVEADTKKLLLNSITGMLQNEHSWLYSPYTAMQVRINGQLIILKLCEKLLEQGCTLIQVNTDAAAYRFKTSDKAIIEECIREVEKETGLSFATDYFKSFNQLAVNDYFAEKTDGEIVKRGCFITDVKLGKGLTPKIIPEAIIKYFADGTPVKDTIYNCKDIKKFLMSEKTGKQWHVEYMNKEQQRTNRFYASTNGGYLWKWKDNEGVRAYQNMLTASGVTILNTFDNKPIEERKINYRYYLREALKIIEELQPRQLNLFT